MKTIKTITFSGLYAELCRSFVEYKRSMGYDYGRQQTYAIRYLCDYLSETSPDMVRLTRSLVEGYIKRKPQESDSTHGHRVYLIRQFGLYLHSLGYEVYLPPYDYIKHDKSFVPYIYTKDEIKRIISASENLPYFRRGPNSQLVYPLMMKILFCCGLRISEVLDLKIADVNVEDGILHIRQSKYNNSRLVPMSRSLTESCQDYYAKMDYYSGKAGYFFEVTLGVPYKRTTCYSRFRYFLKQAKIWHGGRGKGPRLHDARHTYAVYALDHMVKQGMDIYCALPMLSAYMGHRTIESTEKYVRLVPSFHQDIINTMQPIYKGVFPEVTD